MNTRPPPYNPYMYSQSSQLPQPTTYFATAPPMDDFQDISVRYPPPIQTQNIHLPSAPPPIIHIHHIEQKQKQEDNECCCFGMLAIICCCFVNDEI